MSVNCPSSYMVLSCLRILQAWKESMASKAFSEEEEIPFGVGDDLLLSKRKKEKKREKSDNHKKLEAVWAAGK